MKKIMLLITYDCRLHVDESPMVTDVGDEMC